jgi:Ca-activated chloride channel family protein
MTRVFVALVAALAVGAAAFLHYHGNGKKHAALTVSFAYSPNQEELLLPLIDTYNREHDDVEIVGESVQSGDAETKIATRSLRPALWSPASSLWGQLLDYETDASWAPRTSPSLVRTPLVVALWKPEAEALGWPRNPIGFAQIIELAQNRRGWAEYGLPTYGAFKLGHTNPDFSSSGLSFVVAQYFTAAGKPGKLTESDVRRPAVRARVRALQQSIVHYGDTGSFFVDQLKLHGPSYVSAVAMEEVSLLDYNRTRAPGATPLVAIYPKEGTFFFENPLITLHAPWVTRREARASRAFARWLSARVTPALASRYGYRPGDPTKRPIAPVVRSNFVDPAEPRRVLALPEPRVLAAIKRAWHEDRKASNVAVVLDVSGSMQAHSRLTQAKAGLRIFLRQFSSRDRVGLFTFSDHVTPVVPLAPMSSNRPSLTHAIDTLVSGGGTAVYDATETGIQAIAGLHDTTRINAVVVLTDGDDNASRLSSGRLVRLLRGRAEDVEHNVRVFTIAYGSEANQEVLGRIADASGGKGYVGDPTEIAGVYRQISSFF